jgi:hypothetical protein
VKWLVLAFVLVCARSAEPCAPAPPKGAIVETADEEAVIVWDAEHHVEHFIRKAAFHSTAKAFGFLVPTPSTPQLGEVPDHVFDELGRAIAPKVRVEHSGFEPSCICMSGMSKSGDEARGTVHVLQTVHVAGFDATTVIADDTDALAGWLEKHGFERSQPLVDWLAAYVTAHWTITAFVVTSDETETERYDVATRAVHMTFSTDRPFYPYREPPTTSKMPRLLRVYVLADQRFDATFAGQPWTAGRVVFAAPLALPAELAAFAHPFATVFEDTSAPRIGTDELYFAPSADRSEVRPPDIIVYKAREVPLELVFLAVLVVIVSLVLWRRRRRRL